MKSHPSRVRFELLEYNEDSTLIFEKIKDLPGPIFLDSCYSKDSSGRYDILAAQPLDLNLPYLNAGSTEQEAKNYFKTLDKILIEEIGRVEEDIPEIPFVGGLLGYLDYDAGIPINKVAPNRLSNRLDKNNCHFGAYPWAIIQDHQQKKTILSSLPSFSKKDHHELVRRLKGTKLVDFPSRHFDLLTPFESNMTQKKYREAFERAMKYIYEGDCYQVNLAQRFSADYKGDPWIAYQRLRSVSASPYSAFIQDIDGNVILCLSPERFLSCKDGLVKTSPIKGTRPRKEDPTEDQQLAMELFCSDKDRAENIMIVDLLRNDLGKTCIPGSVKVEKLLELKTYRTIHHLVSTVSGKLRKDKNILDLLHGCFPGGSITGAPKRRSMEIIEELELDDRSAYCGSILYISAHGRMDSNIAIRTFKCTSGEVSCWAGGGLVADSTWQKEYQETFDKIGLFLGTLDESFDSRGGYTNFR